MDEMNEEESSSTVGSFEDCGMSSTSDEMRDLALKFLVNLRSDRTKEMTQINGLEAICQITRDILSDGNRSEEEECFGKILWLADINTAMESFPESASIQETACRCLTALLQERPSLCKFIGQKMGQLPLSYNISVAMDKHWDLSALFKSVCDVVLMMLSHEPHLQQDFAKLDIHKAILLKISASQETQELVKAFQVLVYISRDSPEFKEKLLKEDILFCISGVFNVLPSDREVLKQAITLLGTLAESYPLVTYQCVVEEIHLSLLHILRQCKMFVSLLEVTIETLDMFCTAQGISDILVTSGCVELICDLMKSHEKNPEFQAKALTMLQHLVKSPEDVVNVLIPEIKRIMKSFPESCEIQQCGCEMFYNLAKDDYEIAVKLIKERCHQLFFKILANFEDDFVLNSAADCIYLLACEHDLKNPMLFEMCVVGNTTAIGLLLQLSADVNYSEGGDTPLSVACKANNLELVQFLLLKGVTDMHHPLTLCLENRHRHKLAGFLLKRMGHDEDGGTISLTGLKLGTLRKEWLAPSLMGSDTYSYHIESIRWLNLIRKSRQRLSVSTVSSENDEDVLTELSTTDISIPEDMTSDQGSPGTSDQAEPSFEDDEAFSSPDIYIPQPRQRSVSRLSMGHSVSDSRLMTVAECGGLVLPERRDSLNEAFFEKPSISIYTRQRGYSDTQGILRGEKVEKPLGDISKDKLHRTKSESMIEGELNNSACPANPVRCLDLSRNEISNVDTLAEQPSTISFHLSCIENLDLSHNKLAGLPVGLNQNMERLRKLVLSHNRLTAIPDCVFTCSKFLEWVDLSHNNIKNVNKPRTHFMSFVLHLDLSHNSIEEFPSCVSEGFPLLTHLDLSHNYITFVPTKLENIEENQTQSTGEAIKLSKLQTLNLCHNLIQAISASFLTRLINLETFQASHNKLTSLPENISLTKLAAVKLSHNHLVEKAPFYLSKFVLWLPNVHAVDVSENGLKSIAAPPVWHSQRLKDLNVSCNDITTIDLTKAASHWPSLTRLDLSNNNLRQIPKGIGELKSLGQLNISGNNKIYILPNEMGNLAKLWEFLHKDVKLDMNASLLRGRTRDLVGHLHARLKKSAPNPQRKVVVCGPRSSGKTTLLRLLASSKALKKPCVREGRKSKNANESLHIQKWIINDVRGDCRCCSRRNVSLVLRVWEFSGDEASACVHRCFLNETDLHIVVFDASASVEKVDALRPWLANIHDQCPGAMVILVGTHAEKIPASRKKAHLDNITNRIQVIRRLPEIPVIRSIFFVGGNKNSNVDDLANKLLNLAMACNTRGNQIHNHNMPKSFITLQSIMESRARNETNNGGVVHLSLLKKIVQDSKLDINNDELHEAVVCLRQSGLLVNYATPAAMLNELFFLSPPKLAALIAKIVTFVAKVAEPVELITQDKLCDLIVGEGFSNTHVPQILRLLEDFEIALPLSPCKYLLTSNLARNRPSVLVNTDKMSRRRYTMPYAPVGFWGRLVIYLWLYRKEMAYCQRPLIRELEEGSSFQFWRHGFCTFWSSEINFTVTISENILDIFVPQNRHGHVLLANLVYHIDTLLQEWYPHLYGVDSLYNKPIIHKTALCSCREHEFPLEDCITPYMKCTGGGMIPLEQLVPDLLLANVDQRFIIDESDLIIEENPRSMLGEGGFGSVYRAKYKNKNVAVKIFRKQIETDPRVHFEQEVRFLARLRHPSVIDLVGVCFGSRYIAVLELAPLGSLNMIFRSGKPLSRGIQHLIAMQIADGLRFLHHHTIVYRDLKPHNILIFSLAAGSLINAKISDFGSSRYATPCGFIASEGTPGYRAPEVARGDVVYNEKADIFSLGMLLYELATEGKQPFSDLKFRSEFDEAVITGRPIDPIVVANAPPWPDMQDLLDHMLVTEPDQRLTADQVYQGLSDPEFISLKQDIAVCKGQAVECMATRYFRDGGGNKMEVWIGSGASDWTDKKNNNDKNTHTSQLSRVDLSSSKPKGCKGTILQDGRIISITVVGESFILVGTQTGHLWVYDITKATFLHAMSKLRDAVLCLLYVESVGRVFAGMANGQLAMYSIDELRNPPNATKIIDISGLVCCHEQPMMCLALTKHSKKLLCGVGHNIVVFQLGLPEMLPESCLSISPEAEPHKGLVSNIIDDKHGIWTSTKGSARIQLWNMKSQKLRAVINCDSLPISETFDNSTRGMRVVSLLIHNNILWVGTGGGHILLIDTRSSSLLMAMSRHKTAVRCLMSAELLQEDGKQISVVLSGGLGFVPRWSSSRESSSRDFGYVLVWESGIQKESEHLHEYNKRRQEWHLNHSNL